MRLCPLCNFREPRTWHHDAGRVYPAFLERFFDCAVDRVHHAEIIGMDHQQSRIRGISKTLGYRFSRLRDKSRSQENYGEQDRSETFQCWPPATIMTREASQVCACRLQVHAAGGPFKASVGSRIRPLNWQSRAAWCPHVREANAGESGDAYRWLASPAATFRLNSADLFRGTLSDFQFALCSCFARNTICPT